MLPIDPPETHFRSPAGRGPARLAAATVMMMLAGLIGACGHSEPASPATTSKPSVSETEKGTSVDRGANKFTPAATPPTTTPPLNSGNSGYNGPDEGNNGGPRNNNDGPGGGGPGGGPGGGGGH